MMISFLSLDGTNSDIEDQLAQALEDGAKILYTYHKGDEVCFVLWLPLPRPDVWPPEFITLESDFGSIHLIRASAIIRITEVKGGELFAVITSDGERIPFSNRKIYNQLMSMFSGIPF